MAASKSDKPDKVFDVAKPGKAAASASSRPLIIGHKTILKDPMVKEVSVDELDGNPKNEAPTVEDLPSGNPTVLGEGAPEVPDEETELAQSTSNSELVIEPPSSKSKKAKDLGKNPATTRSKTAKAKTAPPVKEEAEADTIVPVTIASTSAKKADSGQAGPSEVNPQAETQTDVAENNVEPESEKTNADAPSGAAISSVDEETSAEAESSEVETTSTDQDESDSAQTDKSAGSTDTNDSAESDDAKPDPTTVEAQRKAEQEAQAAASRSVELEKEISSGQYRVPIGEKTRKKRSLRHILTGIVLILLLGFALVYLMIDVGLIKADVKLPFEFFKSDNTTSTTASTPEPPATKPAANTFKTPDGYAVYENKTLGFKFAYPEAWGETQLQSDPAKTDLFLLQFVQTKEDKKPALSIEVRAQANRVLSGSDEPYAQGFLKNGDQYYLRTGSDTINKAYLIKSADLIAKVNSDLGTIILFKDTFGLGSPKLSAVINLNKTKYPGLKLTFSDAAKAEGSESQPEFDQKDIDTLKTVLSTFTKL